MIQPNRMMATAMPMKPAVIRRRSEVGHKQRGIPIVSMCLHQLLKMKSENLTHFQMLKLSLNEAALDYRCAVKILQIMWTLVKNICYVY